MSTDSTPPERPRPRLVLPIVLGLAVLLLAGIVAYLSLERGSTPSRRPGGVMVFHIARASPSLLPGAPTLDRDEFESLRQSEAALVHSRRTLNAALNTPGIKDNTLIREARPDALSWLADNLRVIVSPSPSGMMSIELDGENEEVLQVLDAIGKAYLAASAEHLNGGRLHRQAELEKMIEECQSKLNRDNQRLEEIALFLGGTLQPATRTFDQFMAKEYEKVSDELRRVRLDRAVYLANRPAPRHKALQFAPIPATGGAPIALAQKLAAAHDEPDTPEGKALAAREEFWQAELTRIDKETKITARHTLDMNNLRRAIRACEDNLERYETALRAMKEEFRSPPRVTVAEEPYFRPVK